MTRLVRRFVAPASSILLGLLAGCASNNPQGPSSGTTAAAGGGGGGTAGTSASGTKSGSGTPGGGSGAAGTGASSGTGSSGGTTQMDAGTQVDAAAFCRVPTIDAGSLPFVVDTAYVPSGWMGDAPQYAAPPERPPWPQRRRE